MTYSYRIMLGAELKRDTVEFLTSEIPEQIMKLMKFKKYL